MAFLWGASGLHRALHCWALLFLLASPVLQKCHSKLSSGRWLATRERRSAKPVRASALNLELYIT